MSEPSIVGYELGDTVSRNVLDDFDTEAEALDVVLTWISENGPGCADALALTRVDADDRMETIATGADLARRAEAVRAERGQLPV